MRRCATRAAFLFGILLFAVACSLIPTTYTVTYNRNGSTSGTVPVDKERYNEGETATVLGNSGNLAKTGFVFGGWNTKSDGTGIDYDQGATIVIRNSNVILYVRWISDTTYLTPLVSGTPTTLSDLNGSKVYTLVSTKPSSRSEGNVRNNYLKKSFNLESSAGGAASLAPAESTTVETPEEARALVLPSTFGAAQVESDKRMRQAENDALSTGAKQLSGATARSPKAAPTNIVVGTPWNDVNVSREDGSKTTIDTVCVRVSAKAYFFSDTRDTTVVQNYFAQYDYANAFDDIVDVDHNKFGQENDVDQNGKVIVVFSEELNDGLLGYFSPIDKFPKSSYSDSNEGDIFYVTTQSQFNGKAIQGNVLKATLAHELQHMIYFDQHYNRGVTSTYTWLNEALSQAAEYYTGYTDNHIAWIKSFLELNGILMPGWAELSLTYWSDGNYGYGAIFVRYLIDQYGDAAIKNMCSTDKVGIAAVEAATGESFNTIFQNFTKALVLSGTGSVDSKYQFTTLNLQTVQPSGRGGLLPWSTCAAGNTLSSSIYPYEIRFNQWSGSFGTMTLTGAGFFGTAFGLTK